MRRLRRGDFACDARAAVAQDGDDGHRRADQTRGDEGEEGAPAPPRRALQQRLHGRRNRLGKDAVIKRMHAGDVRAVALDACRRCGMIGQIGGNFRLLACL